MWKLVLVDDDAIVRRGIVRSIDWATYGFNVMGEATNGEAGLDIVLRTQPDIVVTGIRMPVHDGLWLCEQVARALPDCRIVIISGYEDFSYAKRAIRLGVKDYLVKPVMADDLVEVVRRVAGELSEGNSALSPGLLSSIETESAGVLVRNAITYVQRNYMRPIDLGQVVADLYVSENHLSKVFKAETGVNFTDYLNRIRIDQARVLLDQLDLKIADVAEMVGYQSYKYFHHFVDPSYEAPTHQLAGFVRVHLEPGESKDVVLPISQDQLCVYNEEGEPLRHAGEIELFVGGGQPNARTVELMGATPLSVRVRL